MNYVAVLALGVSGGTDQLVAEFPAADRTAALATYQASIESGDLPPGLTIMDRRIYDALHGAQTNARKIRAAANNPHRRRRSA